MHKQKKDKKHCPLLDQECVGSKCEIYEERLTRCVIPVIAYNLYALTQTLKHQPENQAPEHR
ncbi:MAG: hypothetical protein C4576_30655 [Desulfobacteraceae bacterium]|nr:MAG: hypothetical protein C4576_30655 [Desulfobacteraceae bacterium]